MTDQKRPKKEANKIVRGVIIAVVALLIIIGFLGYNYVNSSLQPLNKDAKTNIVVKVPMGSSNSEIGAQLQKNKVIKSATVFNYYVKAHNYSGFKAGYYSFKASMTLDQIISMLQKGGSSESITGKRVVVKEGVTIDQIGDSIEKNTKFSKAKFLELMKDKNYIKELAAKYPQLLSSSVASKDVRYNLEGYLFPATYDVTKKMTLKSLVNSMVAKSNQELTPYYEEIKKNGLTVQQALTLSSLIEREGVTQKDRQKISGVFFNRIDAKMPLQSDISVMYALNTHKKSLTNKDTSVDSPYNLYVNAGYGPGPFNNPSVSSLKAVLHPTQRDKDYLYFVANLKTGKVYYSKTYSQHLKTNASLGQ
ncbi:endolytic transglycosylase MltG [Lactobacillus sp. YT155]|uniref:endolytic transglycosylase MltG n=1 Tax=Lactobacillus sp. YT155 TaxID=3060955 RepID=UPI00265D7361|nr:endolytic transglycosylase MltG [Lactobacillus sp. YT155]MDO1605582.1 endolytic transglycosylase MltG [Lactobacillus sp. YT155]